MPRLMASRYLSIVQDGATDFEDPAKVIGTGPVHGHGLHAGRAHDPGAQRALLARRAALRRRRRAHLHRPGGAAQRAAQRPGRRDREVRPRRRPSSSRSAGKVQVDRDPGRQRAQLHHAPRHRSRSTTRRCARRSASRSTARRWSTRSSSATAWSATTCTAWPTRRTTRTCRSAPYDPEQAKALLAEAGHADGLEVELITGLFVPDATAFAEQAKASGINIKLKRVTAGRGLQHRPLLPEGAVRRDVVGRRLLRVHRAAGHVRQRAVQRDGLEAARLGHALQGRPPARSTRPPATRSTTSCRRSSTTRAATSSAATATRSTARRTTCMGLIPRPGLRSTASTTSSCSGSTLGDRRDGGRGRRRRPSLADASSRPPPSRPTQHLLVPVGALAGPAPPPAAAASSSAGCLAGLGLAVLVSLLVFAATNSCPATSPARRSGRTATPEAKAELRSRARARPAAATSSTWTGSAASSQGDLGTSLGRAAAGHATCRRPLPEHGHPGR